MVKVKDCPFCGQKAEVGRSFTKMWWQVGCKNKDCYGYMGKSQLIEDPEEAAGQWNSRPSNWIRFKQKKAKNGRKVFDCPLPELDTKILVTDGERVWMSMMYKDESTGKLTINGEDDITKLSWQKLPDPE